MSGLKDKKLVKQTYTKTETCRLYSRICWIFLPNIIKIDLYHLELYRLKFGVFLRHSVALLVDGKNVHLFQAKPLVRHCKWSWKWRLPVMNYVQSVWTDVDSYDSGQTNILASDGHSSTTRQRTMQWPHTVHCNWIMWPCKFNRNINYEMKLQICVSVCYCAPCSPISQFFVALCGWEQ